MAEDITIRLRGIKKLYRIGDQATACFFITPGGKAFL